MIFVLAGYGAEAINPYLTFDTLSELAKKLPGTPDTAEVQGKYIKAITKGMLKVMSKMVSRPTNLIVGRKFLTRSKLEVFLNRYFTGTKCAIGALAWTIANEAVRRHASAYKGILELAVRWMLEGILLLECGVKLMHGRLKQLERFSTQLGLAIIINIDHMQKK